MKKSHAHNVVSDRICKGKNCRKRLKLRMVEQKDAEYCYSCHQKNLKRAGKKSRTFKEPIVELNS